MKTDILVIYEPIAQKPLVNGLLMVMRQNGLDIDAFNMLEMQYHIHKDDALLFYLFRVLQKWIVTRFINKRVFYPLILKRLAKEAKVIDIHYFTREYAPFLEHYNAPYKLTVWGSDFYRETPYWHERKRPLYKAAKIVQVETPIGKRDLISYEPSLSSKVAVCNFGINLLSVIDEVKKKGLSLKPNPQNKLVVTCGYNGHQGQQHLIMFNALKSLPESTKNNLLLFIPATYGLKSDYRALLEKELNELGIDYYLFTERLSESDLAALRLQTDIAVNIQITDSLSSSLIEHLYSGNVLIAGNWLPYELFDEMGIFYMKTTLKDLYQTLTKAIGENEKLKDVASNNQEKVLKMSSWEALAPKQFTIYNQLLQS